MKFILRLLTICIAERRILSNERLNFILRACCHLTINSRDPVGMCPYANALRACGLHVGCFPPRPQLPLAAEWSLAHHRKPVGSSLARAGAPFCPGDPWGRYSAAQAARPVQPVLQLLERLLRRLNELVETQVLVSLRELDRAR
jgi:hypothetical protein